MSKQCVICKKNSYVSSGWHLEGDLDFCSNECVAKFIETSIIIHYEKNKDMTILQQSNQVDKILNKLHGRLSDIYPKLKLEYCGGVGLNSVEIAVDKNVKKRLFAK